MSQPSTLGQLKASGYRPQSIKDELRKNLIERLRAKQPVFEGIVGFEDTVIPDLQRAILSRHNILLLGLRGQAKTRIARQLVELLDEYIPIVAGSELYDDPMQPLSHYARERVAELGDDTPLEWIHRRERFVEKLATPDVSVADLIGDLDPIKAANQRLSYADERALHFGLIPRAHRSIFVLNELPDLQARIQVSLFNILQEGDIQIRGFKLRLPLDIQFVFTANPEDYTNRGSIITPLKDRIESQILTHYPKTIEIARRITQQEARLADEQRQAIQAPDLVQVLLERIAFVARESELVDDKSGVSARLTIAGYENLVSTAERRMLLNGETNTTVRIGDFWGVIPAITGKVELVYEGENTGAYDVALKFIHEALRTEFLARFPNPDKLRKTKQKDPYASIGRWYGEGHQTELLLDASDADYRQALYAVDGLEALVREYQPLATESERLLWMELVLHGLAGFERIQRDFVYHRFSFRDALADMLGGLDELEDEDE